MRSKFGKFAIDACESTVQYIRLNKHIKTYKKGWKLIKYEDMYLLLKPGYLYSAFNERPMISFLIS